MTGRKARATVNRWLECSIALPRPKSGHGAPRFFERSIALPRPKIRTWDTVSSSVLSLSHVRKSGHGAPRSSSSVLSLSMSENPDMGTPFLRVSYRSPMSEIRKMGAPCFFECSIALPRPKIRTWGSPFLRVSYRSPMSEKSGHGGTPSLRLLYRSPRSENPDVRHPHSSSVLSLFHVRKSGRGVPRFSWYGAISGRSVAIRLRRVLGGSRDRKRETSGIRRVPSAGSACLWHRADYGRRKAG